MNHIEGRLEWLNAAAMAAATEAKQHMADMAVLATAQWKAQNRAYTRTGCRQHPLT
jgi:hypothetical protein